MGTEVTGKEPGGMMARVSRSVSTWHRRLQKPSMQTDVKQQMMFSRCLANTSHKSFPIYYALFPKDIWLYLCFTGTDEKQTLE